MYLVGGNHCVSISFVSSGLITYEAKSKRVSIRNAIIC